MRRYTVFTGFLVVLAIFGASMAGCAHKKAKEPTTLSQLRGKRVALAEIKAGPESRPLIEVALINEIIDQGRFEIIDKASVDEALVTYPDRSDWKRLGDKLDADYILGLKVSKFDVSERQYHERIEEEDSALEEETGNAHATRYEKRKVYDATVAVEGTFFNVKENWVSYDGTGKASERAPADKTRRMKLLEKLSQQAIRDFFDKMPKD